MRSSLLFALLLFGFAAPSRAQEADSLWNAANAAYMDGRYEEALRGYEAIRAGGQESAWLYFNWGNAAFKQGLIGPAVLNYNRALRRAPGDEDVRYNLAIANTRVQDKIDTVPVFFLKRWIIAWQDSIPGNAWAGLSVLFFVLLLSSVVIYLLAEGLSWRKGGFYGAIGALVLFVFCFVSASRDKQRALHPHQGVVMSGAAPVKSSPDRGSKDIFVLHEGTVVTVRDSLGDYREVVVSDGNRGWMLVEAIEMID